MAGRRRALAVGVTVGALAALASAAPANAGTANLNCDPFLGRAAFSPGIQVVGGSGSYNFVASAALCEVTWDNGATDTIDLNASGSGTQVNTICYVAQTGTWTSTSSFVNATSHTGNAHTESVIEGTMNSSYSAQFSNGLGQLTYAANNGRGLVSTLADMDPTDPPPPAGCTGHVSFQALNLVMDDSAPPPGPIPNVGGVLTPKGPPPATYPSMTCKTQGGANAIALADDGVLGDGQGNYVLHYSAYVWQAGPSKLDVCARVQSNLVNAGGLLEVDATGSPGAAPVVTTSDTDMTPCTTVVFQRDAPPAAKIAISPAGNPASVCVMANGTGKRITVGTSGSPTPPRVTWTKDPDAVGP